MSFKSDVAGAVSEQLQGVKNVTRVSNTLPQSVAAPIFVVSGAVKIVEIVGEVMTVIQTQLNNTKLIANPTVGADTDICAVLDITAAAVGSMFNITGTLANAMVKQANGAHIAQAGEVVIPTGTIDLSCSASNTGAIKWSVAYIALEAGATVAAA